MRYFFGSGITSGRIRLQTATLPFFSNMKWSFFVVDCALQVGGAVMQNRPIRLIRKSETQINTRKSNEVTPSSRPEPSEREIKTVVSRWVRDHRQRSEEFRQTFAALFKTSRIPLPIR